MTGRGAGCPLEKRVSDAGAFWGRVGTSVVVWRFEAARSAVVSF